jgi:Uncharacterized flavoproteins
MAKVLVVYHSHTGNTGEMAKAVCEGTKSVAGVEVILKKATEANANDLLGCDAVGFGSPTCFGYMAGGLKDFFDRILGDALGKVDGKPYVAFGSCGRGGGEAVASIKGICSSFKMKQVSEGVVATRKPSPEVLAQCQELGKKLAAAKS